MIKNRILFFVIVLITIILSCSDHSPEAEEPSQAVITIDSFDSAMPHGSSLPDAEMTVSDKLKLKDAKGREAQQITFSELKELIENQSAQLALYNFWNLDCPDCLQLNSILNELSNEPGLMGEFDLRMVHCGQSPINEINTYIREAQLTEDVFSANPDSLISHAGSISEGWEGTFPALFIINPNDGTRILYEQAFAKEELQAILLSLTL